MKYSQWKPILVDYKPYTNTERCTENRNIPRPSKYTKNYVVKNGSSASNESMDIFDRVSQAMLWEIFYHTRGTESTAYPNRNYFLDEFKELLANRSKSFLEIGCGNGSTIIPIVTEIGKLLKDRWLDHNLLCVNYIAGIDLSWTSLNMCSTQLLEEMKYFGVVNNKIDPNNTINIETDSLQVRLARLDVTDMQMIYHPTITPGFDAVSLIFVLSALPPLYVYDALRNVSNVLNRNGSMYFRDYCVTDSIKKDRLCINTLGCTENGIQCYRRKNGTLILLFEQQQLFELFDSVNMEVVNFKIARQSFQNRKLSSSWERTFLQCVLRKRS